MTPYEERLAKLAIEQTKLENGEYDLYCAMDTPSFGKLKHHFELVIDKEYRWRSIKHLCKQNVEPDEWGEGKTGRAYIGTTFGVFPSGKYWTLWAMSNMTEVELLVDSAFSEALDFELDRRNMWREAGEGDPCDVYFAMAVA